MAEKTNKLSSDWVRCQSKSRRNRYYLFNKKTGETNWCPDGDANTHLKTVAAKDVVKTPAQDRMKRLQNQLEKKRSKEASVDGAKSSGRRVKKDEKTYDSNPPNADSSQMEKGSSAGSDTKEKIRTSLLSNASHTSPQTVTKTSDKKPNNTPSSWKPSSIQKRLLNASRKSPEKPKSEESKDKESCKQNIVNVPPKRNKNQTSVQLASKDDGIQLENSKSDRPIQRTAGRPVPLLQYSKSLPKSIEKCKTSVGDKVENHLAVEYDENKNQTETEGKGSFLSKIKVFCNNLIKGTTKPNKRKHSEGLDKEILSVKSKPSFKHKQLMNTSLSRGISCDIQNESIDSSDLSFEPPPKSASKAVPRASVLNQSANSRLDRLRKSMQQQQSLQTLSPSACLLSDESVSSPNVSECEPMDWQPIAENFNDTTHSPSTSAAILADLSSVSEYNDTVSENIMRMAAAKTQVQGWKRDHFHFIVDTNVFIEHPTFVDELTTMKLCDTIGTVIYIPYRVLQELDKLKIHAPSESTRLRTTRAIKFLNKAFEERRTQFRAQSAADEGVHLIKVTSPDDSILNCCLQVKKHVDNVLLLTEDVNLQSKAKCNDILVSTKSDLISLH